MTEFTDDYFINLTMDFDKRDDTIYPQWAVWCAKSGDRYYIDGKDGHFFTHVRTDDEIAEERRKRLIMNMILRERIENHIDGDEEKEASFKEYEEYLKNLLFTDEMPKRYSAWLKKDEEKPEEEVKE